MKEPADIPTPPDLTVLCERAQRVRAEAERLSSDYHFIVAWYRMRPRAAVRPCSMLDE